MRRAGGRATIAATRDPAADTAHAETRQMNAPSRRIFYFYEKKTLQLFMFIVRGEILVWLCVRSLPIRSYQSLTDSL